MILKKTLITLLSLLTLTLLLTACGLEKIEIPEQPPYHPELENDCCQECVDAFSQSPVGVGPSQATCGEFTTGQPLNETCADYFEVNQFSAAACNALVRANSKQS